MFDGPKINNEGVLGTGFNVVNKDIVFTMLFITIIRSKLYDHDCLKEFYNCVNLDRTIYNQRSGFETA
jgi:hypothetical protein